MVEKWRDFKEIDPFNPQNTLMGKICHEQGEKYGRTHLTQVNDEPCNRIIYSTPKMFYPFDKNGKFYFPKLESDAIAYIKHDGTNILAYSYYYRGKKFVTYKTRLNPILRSGRFGDFYKMWTEILEMYPEIPKIVMEEDEVNISFELIGVLNKILVLYPFRLDIRLLFGIDNKTGTILLPDYFKSNSIPIAEKYYTFTRDTPFPETYNELREKIEKENQYLDNEVVGIEGLVIYSRQNDEWKQWKLKPETIFKLHTKGGMSKKDIMITCYNAFENYDNVTFPIVKELLLEEFPENEIIKNEYKIKNILEEVKEEIQFRKKIIEIYEEIGIRISEDKRKVMREMSKYFNKNQMRYVYSIISAYEGLTSLNR